MTINQSDTDRIITHENAGFDDHTAAREKWVVAISSVAAAVLLTGMKLVVGLLTGSLGILSEAVHSALDLVAAIVTSFAVRLSGRPADREHMYGHGKIENLSALFETLLLLATCGWIIMEAIERLFFKSVEVEATSWSFIIMILSIGIDFTRSRALYRVAKKYDSQALEADALHFSTDIWSSLVVLGGLTFVLASRQTGIHWLSHADSVAALGVAMIVIWVCYRLGRKSIADLLDEVPPGIPSDIRRSLVIPGVYSVPRIRVRRSGPDSFVDLTIRVAANTSLEFGHEVAEAAERSVHRVLPRADVMVHVEPIHRRDPGKTPGMPVLVRETARQLSLEIHNVQIYDVLGRRSLECHLEVSESFNVFAAHELASTFEKALRERIPDLDWIVTHIEPMPDLRDLHSLTPLKEENVIVVLEELTNLYPTYCLPHDVKVYQVGKELVVSLHCSMDGNISITEAHDFTGMLERTLCSRLRQISRVVIHVEPIEPSFEEKKSAKNPIPESPPSPPIPM